MVKQLTFILLFSIIIKNTAQENRIMISGKIKSDASSLENIHIYNKNSSKGTISNVHGQFTIPVKVNDTILLSGIQFYQKEIIINNQLIKNKFVTIELFQKINELDVVELKTHELSGNLISDTKKVKDSISKVNKMALDFSMIDFKKPVISDIDRIDRRKPPDISQLTNPHLQKGFGASFSIGRIKKKKSIPISDKIRIDLGNDFFTKILNIPLNQIDSFISFCEPKGIYELYKKKRKMEVIDILIKESTTYKGLDSQD